MTAHQHFSPVTMKCMPVNFKEYFLTLTPPLGLGGKEEDEGQVLGPAGLVMETLSEHQTGESTEELWNHEEIFPGRYQGG